MTSPYPSTSTSPAPSDRSLPTESRNSSSVRPRNRRLVSTEQELETTVTSSRTNTTNRGVSPIPSTYPSRVLSGVNGRPIGGLLAPSESGGGRGNDSPKWGWTGSWTTLQGLASSVLGGDLEADTRNLKNGANPVRRRRASSVRKPAPATWGPSGGESTPQKKDASVGTGSSAAARDTAVKARKTASVLESYEGVNGGLAFGGRYKRRTSSDDSGVQEDDNLDALVYVHHVLPSDTLAGVVLRYNCQPAIFRKANRLWPNDVIQIRKVVLLPVDACAIKGRPCDPPTANTSIDLLAPTPIGEEAPNMASNTNADPWGTPSQTKDSNYTEPSNPDEDDPPWTHVRWVLLSASPSSRPTEIARLPRKTLGYFPPRRRKSQTTISTVSSPGSSNFQYMPRHSTDTSSVTRGTPSRRLSNLSQERSANGSYFPAPTLHPSPKIEPRRDSTSEPRLEWMRGPGGVGTFNKNVRKPGPAQDGLNSWAAKHLPGLGMGNLPSLSAPVQEAPTSFGFRDEFVLNDELRSFPVSGVVTPNGGVGPGLGLEHAAAAIEGWVRRFAIKTAPGTPKLGSGNNIMQDEGDLIELLDGTGSDDGRGFEPTTSTLRSVPAVGSSGREDIGSSIGRRLGLSIGGGMSKGSKKD